MGKLINYLQRSMIKKTQQYFIFIILLSSFWAACDKERDPCLQPKTVSIRIGTYQPADTGVTVIDSLLPHPIWTAVDDTFKSILFPEKTAKFSLLLSTISDSCQYIMQPDSAILSFDTITFYYARKLQFLSNACGYSYFFLLNDIKYTQNNIDSLIINNPDVNSSANTPEHVQIYF